MLRPVLLASLFGTALPGFAADVTIDFSGIAFSAYFGHANLTPAADGSCGGSGSTNCLLEDGFVIGTVSDSGDPGEHFHRAGTALDRAISYHSDAPGLYFRRQDGAAFSFKSLDFEAPISDENPDTGPNDVWEIYGFSSATNVGLGTGPLPTPVAFQTVTNGYNANLSLDAAFNNVSAVWLVYKGYYQVPTDGKSFEVVVDNLVFGDPVTATPVPVPALGLWGLGSLIAGLGVHRQRRRS